MVSNFLSEIATQLGIPISALIAIIIWSLIWKLIALWISARKKQLVWFIVLAIVNTLGILEILYIFVLSKIKLETEQPRVKKVDKKTRKRK